MKEVDVIVITRGGGSITDLSCFDSQMIAEKIASVNIPVLTGIGHEIDTTITDLAAHTFQKRRQRSLNLLSAALKIFSII